ncbi:hypothetical protein G6F59_013181 [Rhizopus arrhizus]|nr:hypothetical protein G6F59_013181 [Rhizopus arrhizus]
MSSALPSAALSRPTLRRARCRPVPPAARGSAARWRCCRAGAPPPPRSPPARRTGSGFVEDGEAGLQRVVVDRAAGLGDGHAEHVVVIDHQLLQEQVTDLVDAERDGFRLRTMLGHVRVQEAQRGLLIAMIGQHGFADPYGDRQQHDVVRGNEVLRQVAGRVRKREIYLKTGRGARGKRATPCSAVALHRYRQAGQALPFGLQQQAWVGQHGGHQRVRVVAPEQLVVDGQGGDPEHARGNRGLGIAPQLLLDRRLGDGTVGILDAKPRGRLAQRIGTVGGVSVAPDPVEQHIQRLCAGAGGQAQAQRRQRVERMARRGSQGRTLGLRGPQQLAVDETTLGGNLGRTEVAQCR